MFHKHVFKSDVLPAVLVTNQIYGCWNNTKAHNAGVNQAEAVVSWICFCGSSVSLEKKHGDTTQWTEKNGKPDREWWPGKMNDVRFLARHITAWRPIPLLPTSSQYIIESYVYCRVFYIQMSQSNESNVPCCPKNQTKDPATCSKNNRGLPPIRGKSSPSQTWPGFLATRLGHGALLTL